MAKLNTVSYSPHIKTNRSTIMFQLATTIALLGISAWGIYIYGINSAIVLASCVVPAVATEILFNLIYYKKFVFDNFSSIVVGLAIGLTMPPDLPFYCGLVGSVVSILLIKLACGGLGKNFVSEIAFGKVITYLIFGEIFTSSFVSVGASQISATTLAETTKLGKDISLPILDLFMGKTVGGIGETAIILLLITGIILCVLKAVDWKIPFFYLFTVSIAGLLVVDVELFLQFLASSGIVFVAFYVATDFASAPNTAIGKILYAVMSGLVTILIWEFGNFLLAPYFAVLICGLIFSALSDYFKPKFARSLRGDKNV